MRENVVGGLIMRTTQAPTCPAPGVAPLPGSCLSTVSDFSISRLRSASGTLSHSVCLLSVVILCFAIPRPCLCAISSIPYVRAFSMIISRTSICALHSSPAHPLIGAATPHVPNQAPMPQRSKVPNPNSRGHAIKRGLRVPNHNSRGHATKRGFRDCPGFLNSTGRLGPKRGRKCYVTPAFSGVPNKGDKIRSQNLR